MKTNNLVQLSFIFIGSIFLASCVAPSQCTDSGLVYDEEQPTEKQLKASDFWSSKRYKQLRDERDGLCSEKNVLKTDTSTYKNNIRALNNSLDSAENAYKNLANLSDKKLSELNDALQKKSLELSAKEKLLQEREQRLRELEAVLRKQDSIVNGLSQMIKNALVGFNSDELTTEIKNGKVYIMMSDKLLFKSGKADVEAKGKEALGKLAEVLNKNTDINIQVEGHTDSIPIKTQEFKDNWDLSVARATNVTRILTESYKVDAKRLTASGKGEFSPKDTNSTPEGRAKNRRTEIILSPKLDNLFNLLGVL